MASRKIKLSEKLLRVVPGESTYRFDRETALELEIYSQVGKHGPKKRILELALRDWYEKNPLRPKVREAAMLLLEERGEE